MNPTLRLLQVEDSPSDAAIVDRLLSKAGYEVLGERVETSDEMTAALAKQQWDIIIADYHLPTFNAAVALQLLKQTKLDIPFIVVSGLITDDIAVELMKAGAADYLMKDNLARLVPAVERELRVALTRRERGRTVEDLVAEKERLLVTLCSIGDAVITTDARGVITLMNKVCEDLTGWPLAEAVGRPLTEVFKIINGVTGEACENPVERVLKTGEICWLASNTTLINRNGNKFLVADSGAPIYCGNGAIIGVVLIFRDVTIEKKTEYALRDAERLQSLGVFAGGIAHDFNNLLSGMFGNIELAEVSCETRDLEKVSSHLSAALSVFSRARNLSHQLVTFAHGGKPVKRAISLADILRKSSEAALGDSGIELEIQLPNDLWLCWVDQNQIGQVIENIVSNSRQAMSAGGVVKISAKNLPSGSSIPPILPPGDYIRVAIHDQGTGIAKELLPRIFDPFFSTKNVGRGLGLAIAYAIMKKHGGLIEAESDYESGTTFSLFLPRF